MLDLEEDAVSLIERPQARPTAPLAAIDPPDPLAALMGAVLNEIDYPLILLTQDLTPLYANRAAQGLLHGELPGRPGSTDRERLRQAVVDATQRGRRSFITVKLNGGGEGCSATPVAVIPQRDAMDQACALLILAKPELCPALTLQGYARAMGLTDRETQVLQGLSAGQSPEQMARERGVALSTVRTQLSTLRAKTGAKDMKSVTQCIGRLPPLVHALCGQI